MVQSQNKNVDLSIKGRCLNGFTSDGNIMVGDKAFEFYNEKNVEDYIQIPYKEISFVRRSLSFFEVIKRGIKNLIKK